MKRVAALLFAGLCLIAAPGAVAVDLGDVEVGSLRGEPLMVRIALPGLPEGGEEGLRVGLGGVEDFLRAGIERPAHLDSLQFRIVTDGPEPPYVMVLGHDPIDAPSVSFLVEAVWAGGRVLREYTVPLDSAPPRDVVSYGPIRETDTLWSLARRYRPEGISVQRMMLAVLAANPHAFTIGNVNALREGAVLDIPGRERIGSDDKAAAMQAVRHHNEAWQVRFPTLPGVAASPEPSSPERASDEVPAPPPDPEAKEVPRVAEAIAPAPEASEARLRVITPGTGEEPGSELGQKLRVELALALEEADSRRQEVSELSARLDEADQLIADLYRLVALKDDDIAGLQRRLAAEVEAATEARNEALLQARVAVRAQEEAKAQAEAADLARAEAAELAAAIEPDAGRAAPEPAAEPEEEREVPRPDVGEEAQRASAVGDDGPGAAPEEDPGAALSSLEALEERLGFSPVVGGVGLVGVILILGGLVALMRRRGAGREYGEEHDLADEDGTSDDAWDDEESPADESLAGESTERRDGAASASGGPDERAPVPALRRSGREPAVDEFDIGIDRGEDVTRAFEEDLASGADFDRETKDLVSALGSDDGSDPGRSPLRAPPDAAPVGDSRLPPATGEERASRGRGPGSLADLPETRREHDGARRGASSSNGERGEDGAALIAGEFLAGEIDEVQTKLDLAQTYIDMEDFEDARTLLREAQAEGDIEQRAIARYLSGKLP